MEVRGDDRACQIQEGMIRAGEEDWGMEYLDAVISLKVVSGIEEAISHINQYNTGHSESIITRDYASALKFQDEMMRQPYMSMHPRALQTGMSLASGLRLESAPRNFTPEGPWGWRRLQRQNTLSLAMDRYVLKQHL